jgi:hypothetical protein
MADYDERYIVTSFKPEVGEAPWTPYFEPGTEGDRLISLDSEIIKGAFYLEVAWWYGGDWAEKKGPEGTIGKHKHDFPEVIAFLGSDPKNPKDLGGVLDCWIDGRQNLMTQSFVAFIPAGVEHGPIRWKSIDKPVIHFTAGMGEHYNKPG